MVKAGFVMVYRNRGAQRELSRPQSLVSSRSGRSAFIPNAVPVVTDIQAQTANDGDKAVTVGAVGSSGDVIAYPGIAVRRVRPTGGKRKRIFDVIGTTAILVASSPLLLALAGASKIFNPGPLFFGHSRVGFDGKEFQCLKFRTMIVDSQAVLDEYLASHPEAAAEWKANQKLKHDPRVTRFGAILRKTSLDELPQLLNVLRGDMSLVGPRPVTEAELEKYGTRRSAYLATRPGMSGLWQVSGRNSTTYQRRTELDEQYVRSWSMSLDIGIILRTLPEMLASRSAS